MRRGGRTLGAIDIYFFITALRNPREIVDYSAARLGLSEVALALKTFDATVPDAKTIRDIHDHIKDYLRGQGQLQRGQQAVLPKKFTRTYGWNLRDLTTRKGEWRIEVDGLKVEVRASYEAAKLLVTDAIGAMEKAKQQGKAI